MAHLKPFAAVKIKCVCGCSDFRLVMAQELRNYGYVIDYVVSICKNCHFIVSTLGLDERPKSRLHSKIQPGMATITVPGYKADEDTISIAKLEI